VLLTTRNAAALGVGVEGGGRESERMIATQAEVARAPLVLKRVVERAAPELSVDELRERSSVSAKANADLLVFRVEDTDPRRAVLLATEYAKAYTDAGSQPETAALRRTRASIEARLDALRKAGARDSALYATLVDKREQIRTLETLETSNAVLLRAASEAQQVSPTPLRDTALGLALGLLLGIGLALLAEALDTRVRSADEIAAELRLPGLGRLSPPPRRLERRGELVMAATPSAPQASEFRLLRTSVDLTRLERPVRTIMVTSAAEGEGKSTTAANLAIAFARAGRRVVLVDLDLTRAIIGRLFALEGRPGLVQVALDELELDDALVPVALPVGTASRNGNGNGNGHAATAGVLHVLPVGDAPPNAGDVIGTPTLAHILEGLSERADLVIVDAAPLLATGEAMALTAAVDAVIVVARLGTVRKPALRELRRVLASCPAEKLGFVVTGARQSDVYYYGGGDGAHEQAQELVR
jgi:succinoglycan biosynthesis transport protein ExoP